LLILDKAIMDISGGILGGSVGFASGFDGRFEKDDVVLEDLLGHTLKDVGGIGDSFDAIGTEQGGEFSGGAS
jgi:hypothetical protein